MFRVSTRWDFDNVSGHTAKCLNLPGIEIVADSREEMYAVARLAMQMEVEEYALTRNRVPWLIPDPMIGNQTIWLDLNLQRDNLPPGNTLASCISCGKNLMCEDFDGVIEVVYGGLICSSRGNYGSTVFDLNGGELHLYLCDDCAIKKSAEIIYVEWKIPRRQAEKVKTFKEYRKEEDAD